MNQQSAGKVDYMKNHEELIGKVIVALAVIIGAWIIAQAIQTAGGTIGSQIAAAISNSGI